MATQPLFIQQLIKVYSAYFFYIMGNIASKTTADGADRSMVAQLLDPVGACIQPADLSPWGEKDIAAAPASPPMPQEESTA